MYYKGLEYTRVLLPPKCEETSRLVRPIVICLYVSVLMQVRSISHRVWHQVAQRNGRDEYFEKIREKFMSYGSSLYHLPP